MMDAFFVQFRQRDPVAAEGDLLYRICRALQSGSMRPHEKPPRVLAKTIVFQLPVSDVVDFRTIRFRRRFFSRRQLPVFDASKEGFRIQDAVVRILKKRRRQEPVVGGRCFAPQTQASRTGSLATIMAFLRHETKCRLPPRDSSAKKKRRQAAAGQRQAMAPSKSASLG
jgi:hypothetical protein